MKKSFVSMLLATCALLLAFAQTAHAGDVNSNDYSLKPNASSRITSEASYIEATQTFKLFPDYSLGGVKPSLRFAPNLGFDGKPARNELWPRMVITNQDFIGATQTEIPVNYSLNDDQKRRQFLDSLPFVPYFHFEKGNTSAGILFWTDGKVNMFWKIDF